MPRGALGDGEEQVAIPEALQRVEQRVVGLALFLNLLGFAEARYIEIDADHPAPAEDGQVSPLRVGEALHHSKWNEIATVLASGPNPGITTGEP